MYQGGKIQGELFTPDEDQPLLCRFDDDYDYDYEYDDLMVMMMMMMMVMIMMCRWFPARQDEGRRAVEAGHTKARATGLTNDHDYDDDSS